MRRGPLSTVAALALLATACHSSGDAVMVLVVTISGTPSPVSMLNVTITEPAGVSASNSYTRSDGEPIAFPTTLAAELPPNATGNISIAVTALGPTGSTVATGRIASTMVAPGSRPTVYVGLTCGGSMCAGGTGGSSGADGGADAATSPRCGNGRVDLDERCDIAIAPGDPGACPTGCDDGVSCTIDTVKGSGCQLYCDHTLITNANPINDGCCPSAATHATDPDCSPTCGDGMVQPGETCDTLIAPGLPGACPTPGECTSTDPCTVTKLVSSATCQAICVHYQWTLLQGGDSCCPPGATYATDTDCPPSCGDGVVGMGESCDVGILPPKAGSCPTNCDDGKSCTNDFLVGNGCTVKCAHTSITTPTSGDGCCLDGGTSATDTDCPPRCGDGVVEPGESCDSAAVGPGACPTACPPSPSACVQTALTGSTSACTATCVSSPIAACSAQSDGCCPAGCTAATDPDCSATCGDGKVQTDESCDVGIPVGSPGACPTACDDGNPCTTDLLLSGGTCAASCVHLPVTAFVAGDGCCPPGGDLTVDADCAGVCGDGVVDPPVETCDKGVAGSCPTACQAAPNDCTKLTLVGSPSTCSSLCVATPITACANGDHCCPAGCTAATDTDCFVVCGDGVVEASEQCDRAITAGMPGACARTCDDADACTTDTASGSIQDCTRGCTHFAVVACLDNDGCCPAGCTAATDSDCAPICGDGHVGAGETCDPPATCPTTCPDDGDPCTLEQLVGDPLSCNSACRHVPITTCSTATSDHCCPTGCTSATDSDC